MSTRPIARALRRRLFAALRVLGSFLAAAFVGSILLPPVLGPFALVAPIGAIMLGFPSLAVAMALAFVFDRSIRAHPALWCVAATVMAVSVMFASQNLFDYGPNLNFTGVLALQHNHAQAALAAYFAVLTSIIFYAWESKAGRPAQASS